MTDPLMFCPALSLGIASWALTLIVGILFALVGGAAMGIKLGGKDLGNEMAGMMGALYGVSAAAPAVILGLIILMFL